MKQLDIKLINSQSPYEIKKANEENFFEFFNKNNTTLLYICDTGDGKQRQRNRLFERWFAAYNNKALYTSVTSSVIDEDGVINYATIIVRNDNPKLVEVIAEFTSTISLLSQKP